MATTTVAPVVGIPVKILHEAEGHIVSCETIMGETYRGKLIEAEDNMNLQMQAVTVTKRDGSVYEIEDIFIRGSSVRFMILPDMLKNAPMLKDMGKKDRDDDRRGRSSFLGGQSSSRGGSRTGGFPIGTIGNRGGSSGLTRPGGSRESSGYGGGYGSRRR